MAGRSKTWWGQEFLSALEDIMDQGRLQRGRGYDNKKRLVRFRIRSNTVTSKVRGNKSSYFRVYDTPYYDVEISFEPVPLDRWDGIFEKLGSNAEWVTRLILGEVPSTIETAFEDSKVKLLPTRRKDIHSSCSCPDKVNPCKHIAGTYFRVASRIDYDPLLLFELRGLKRSALFKGLSKSEFGAALYGRSFEKQPEHSAKILKVKSKTNEAPASDLRAYWRGKPLPPESNANRGTPLPTSALLLRKEGDYPEFWNRENSFIDAMATIYDRIAKDLPKGLGEGSPFDD